MLKDLCVPTYHIRDLKNSRSIIGFLVYLAPAKLALLSFSIAPLYKKTRKHGQVAAKSSGNRVAYKRRWPDLSWTSSKVEFMP
jgi:hypothetical protein